MFDNGDITRAAVPRPRIATAQLHLRPGRLYTQIREPYFFSFVRDQLIDEYGANTVRSGGLRVYTTIDPRLQRAAQQAIRDALYERTDPAAAVVSIDPRTGAIRAMTAVTPGQVAEPVQHRRAGAAPAGLDVQDDGAHGRGRRRDEPATRPTTRRRRSTTSPIRTRRARAGAGTSRPTTTATSAGRA